MGNRNEKLLFHFKVNRRFRINKLSKVIKIIIIRDKALILKNIGVSWFEIMETLKEDNLLNELKKDMSNKHYTLIGDYVGSKILKYTRKTIIFHSIVENESLEPCIPTPQAYEFFLKYLFYFSPVQRISKSIYSFASLAKILKELYAEISTSHISNEEEGSVLIIFNKGI